MILAAAECAEDEDASPPEILLMAWQAKNWTTLPEPGGLLDQPAGLIHKMTVMRNIHDAFKAFRSAKNVAEWCEQNADAWKIIENVMQLRKLQDHAT